MTRKLATLICQINMQDWKNVMNVMEWEEVIKYDKDQTYAFFDEFLEEAMKTSSLYETDEDVVMNNGHQTMMFMQHLA
jgi:hypothetical protein